MVAYYFPPLATSGAMRPLGFCRHLHEWGWAPRVVAADPWALTPPLPVDAALGRRIPAAVHVDRVGHITPIDVLVRIRNAVRRRLSGAAPANPAPRPAGDVGRPGSGFLHSLMELALEHLFLVPDAQRWWLRRAVNAGASGDRPDVVYATGSPWTSLLVGRALARWYRVPFVADFRDPWVRNPFRAFLPFVRARSRRLERRICRDAARVVVNTMELREQFAADYPEMRDKFIAVSNGFDDGDGSGAIASPPRADPAAAGAVELWHFGTVYGKRTPAALLEAVSRLHAAGRIPPGRLRIRFVGAWELPDDDAASRLAARLEADGLVTRDPSVAHHVCLLLMRQAPVLLVIQPDSPLQVPAKIFEYISARRPLLVIGGEGATAALVDRHRLGRSVANDSDAIETLLAALADGEALAAPPAASVDEFSYRRLSRQLAGVFDAAVRVAS